MMGVTEGSGSIHRGVARRVGLLLPSPNILTEREFNRFLPAHVAPHATRLKIEDATAAGLDAMVSGVDRAADELRDTAPELIVFACTSGSFLKGREYDRELRARIRARSGVATITTSGAVEESLRALGARTLSVVTPYEDDLNQRAARFLDECGYEVRAMRGFGEKDGLSLASYGPDEIRRLAEESFDPTSDAVLLLCTNFRATEVIDPLEAVLGVPVVSSNQATLWATLRTLEEPPAAGTPGMLFRRD